MAMTQKQRDAQWDKGHGIHEGSAKDLMIDAKKGIPAKKKGK